MKLNKIIGISFGLLMLTAFAQSEARSHFSMGFGANMVERRTVLEPVYVEEYYSAPVIVERSPYEYREPVMSRVVVPAYRPVYRERVVVQPRPFFSFGWFFR